MQDLALSDNGSADIDPREMLTDELICFVEGLNPALGTDKDAYHGEFQSFLEEIAAAGVVTIDPESISAGRFDDVDLSGREEEVKDIPDSYYVDYSGFIATMALAGQMAELAMRASVTPFDREEDGYFFSDVFATPFGDYEEITSEK